MPQGSHTQSLNSDVLTVFVFNNLAFGKGRTEWVPEFIRKRTESRASVGLG